MIQQEPVTLEQIRQIVREEVERAMKKDPAARQACFIASKGTLDWAYPPLILSTAAAAAGLSATVFFTFYGLNIIRKDFEKVLRVSPVGNPAILGRWLSPRPPAGIANAACRRVRQRRRRHDVGASDGMTGSRQTSVPRITRRVAEAPTCSSVSTRCRSSTVCTLVAP